MPRYNHALFGKYPIEIEYELRESEHSICCGDTHVDIVNIYDVASGDVLEIVESQDIRSYFVGKIAESENA